ncbi:MAG TPA: DCC1-like thiol-disulfide oxidoreductase family protein [Candidatus Elarobacter sp.]
MAWDDDIVVARDPDGALIGRRFVIFDGSCGFCTWSVRWVRSWDPSRRLTYVPYQALEPHDFERFGTSRERCAREVQFADGSGRLSGGAAAINGMLCAIPRTRRILIVAAVAALPIAFALESAAYRFVARNRIPISRMLGTAKHALFDADEEPPRGGTVPPES